MALRSVALLRIEKEGIDKLSLRALAQDIGVSQTTPYRHFKDKQQLLVDLASTGFELLGVYQEKAMTGKEGLAIIIEMGLAYLEFAKSNPAYYKLMYGICSLNYFSHKKLVEKSGLVFTQYIDQLKIAAKSGYLVDKEPKLLAQTLLASLHGAAAIQVLDLRPVGQYQFELCHQQFVTQTVQGIAKQPI